MKQISKLGAASYPAPGARWGHRWSGVLCYLVLLLQIVTNILEKNCSKSVITTTQLSSSFRLHSHSENRHFKFYSTPVVVPKMGGSHLDSVPSWMLSFIQTRSFIRLFLPSPVTNTAPSNIIISSLLYLRTLHLRCKILGFCCDIFSYKFEWPW